MTDAAIALSGRTLGALLYYPPLSPNNTGLLSALTHTDWEREWPAVPELDVAAALIRSGLTAPWHDTLEATWQALFIGPYALPAPPWGSVYLDRESVVFGESTLALRHWLRQEGITAGQQGNDPEDHIGLLLMLAAWLAENNDRPLNTLLEQHLLPWSGRYLDLLAQGTDHPFYQGVAQLTQATLAYWQRERRVTPSVRELYR
ncbi:Tat proofreading chaperone DmsD [Acerihabitans sp. TG2]|uniref:Tat proofreading chaperone DmsD n=1 Tax=Acerihabitans sp. TG2 TaxID=3096008 RepID=UPI002B2356C6|nr:Tat proofreading chaperone DmsD [Acerihabitans sp. TG2]MEA9389591.1 Tat proofreading chaperone DmsD [Acerihabitans sp. TG2]